VLSSLVNYSILKLGLLDKHFIFKFENILNSKKKYNLNPNYYFKHSIIYKR